ncbi:MAG TPA: acyl-CoA synthetase [Ramlibacter sp.]|uniref:acyl-CoA synthetase n=1 Tax=Ramlibacter sp. TaxID=1917967 RepID=UPI002B9AEB7F|nr:acyl-CoA synthetase [Ramlibacter sp.]HVZ45816.1 acyl-CoA synthetase [Ramlibacter sp.]
MAQGHIVSGSRKLGTEALQERAARAASGFEQLGVGAGDTVVLYLRNDFALIEASLAAGMVGAYPVPANWHFTAEEAAYLFQDTGAKVIVVHADLLEAIESAIPADAAVLVVSTPPEVQAAYRIAARGATAPSRPEWDAWVASFPARDKPPVPAPGTMIYTSGTTGRPKGVRRLQPTAAQSRLATHVWSSTFGFDRIEPSSLVTVVTGPMYHSAPNSYGILAARMGGTVILQPRFDALELLALVERHRVTHLHMVPIMFNRLLKLDASERERWDLSSLQFVIHSAAPVSPLVKREMLQWWGPVIFEYYGTSETSILASCGPQEWLEHPGTVGKPLPDVDLKIFTDDPGAGSAAPGPIGARTAQRAGFTYHRDDAKRERASRDGYFLTGDIGYLDADGFLFLCDRATDMIISGGVNIYPAEIEAELHKMPGVKDCAVFGIPDEEFGESICAVIETPDGAAIGADDVKSYLRGRLAGYKVPRRVEFGRDLPREDSGKIFKRKLRAPYWAGTGRTI